jgi:multiple sugar transport system substrate-binding protein
LIALPIDVATQVASYRADILESIGTPVPATWDDVIALAERGRVLIPGFHVDVLLTFLGFCVSLGSEMFTEDGRCVSREAGRESLRRLAEVARHLPQESWTCNPIAVYERMCSSNDFAYCPFAYGYHNYSRDGFAPKRLHYTNLVSLPTGESLRGVLGGTGIGISRQCREPEAAAAFCCYVASEVCQGHIYFLSGGQPAHKTAWNDPLANHVSGNFFANTRRSTEEAWIRPRYNGYVGFQESAGLPIVEYLRHGGDADAVLDVLDARFRNSRKGAANA